MPEENTEKDAETLAVDTMKHLRRNGAAHLIVATAFFAEAATDLIAEVPPTLSVGFGIGITLGGIAKFCYAHRIYRDLQLPESPVEGGAS